jgi:hypothetical protein
MQKISGVICLVIGIVLLLRGHNIAHSVGSQVRQIFTGSPTDRAIHFYIGGLALAILGVALIFWKRK